MQVRTLNYKAIILFDQYLWSLPTGLLVVQIVTNSLAICTRIGIVARIDRRH
jgi:hypothetical protein